MAPPRELQGGFGSSSGGGGGFGNGFGGGGGGSGSGFGIVPENVQIEPPNQTKGMLNLLNYYKDLFTNFKNYTVALKNRNTFLFLHSKKYKLG